MSAPIGHPLRCTGADVWLEMERRTGAPCPVPGCDDEGARWSPRLAEALRPLCTRCRQDAHEHLAKHPEAFPDEAVAHVVDRAERRALAASCRCPVCGDPAEPFRAWTAPELRPLCPVDRQRARLLIAKGRATPATVVARLLATPTVRRSAA